MIVQHRVDGIHVIGQNEHAIVSGEMALRWQGAGGSGAASLDAVLAIALHDSAWIAIDEEAPCDASTGLPFDFQSLPTVRKVSVYGTGIDALEAIHPYAALLLSMHYSFFISAEEHPEFRQREQRRQQALRARLGSHHAEEDVAHDFALLRLLDVMSLRLCITPPGTLRESWPSWITGPRDWRGVSIEMSWRDESTFVVEPFPFDRPFEVAIPTRVLAGVPGRTTAAQWRSALSRADLRVWRVRVAG